MQKKIKAFMQKVLKTWKGQVIKAVLAAMPAEKLAKMSNEELTAKIMDQVAALGLTLSHDDLMKLIDQAARQGGIAALVQIDVEATEGITSQVNKLALDYANERAAELVGKKWVDGELIDNPKAEWAITESTREFLRSDITQAIDEGWSTAKLSDTLQENYAFSEARCDMIARTEAAKADIEGNMIAYRESGVVEGKEWLLSPGGHDLDDECDENADAGGIGLDEDFPSGDDSPPAHPNCLCSVVPIVGEA